MKTWFPHRRHLHHLLPRAQRPGRDRRGGNRTLRPAPDRPGVLRGDRRARRGGRREPDAPLAQMTCTLIGADAERERPVAVTAGSVAQMVNARDLMYRDAGR